MSEKLMSQTYTYLANLDQQLPEILPDTIVSRSVYSGDDLKVTLFGFAPGQELTEHTAARPAVLHFLRGEATVTLGAETFAAQAGTFIHMPAQLPHSVTAQTEVVMLLLMVARER